MTRPSPCVLIGWDGATFDLLLPWVRQGLLPNLAKMLERGSARRLRSMIPPVSPAAWVSILTGMNPGKHGIFDFKEFDATDYVPLKPVLVNSTHFSGTTILDVLSQRGLRICSLQLPLTYPTWPINGFMLAGIPNPDDCKAYTYPPERAPEFEPLLPFPGRRKMSFAELFEQKTYHIRKLTDVFCQLARENYDLFFVYFRESDDFHHLFWRLLAEDCPGYDPADRAAMGNPILSIYQKLDAELGRALEALPEANYFLISDHGGTAMGRRRLHLNTWLHQQRYLTLRRSLRGTLQRAGYRLYQLVKPWVPNYLRNNLQNERPRLARAFETMKQSTDAIDWPKSRAYAVHLNFPTVGIQLNVRGREKHGCVEPGAEFEALRDELIERLNSIVDPEIGQRVVREIYRREEIFSGPYVDRLPDIVLHYDAQFVARTELAAQVWGATPLTDFLDVSGDHDMNGIFVAVGPAIRSTGFLPEATILDVAPSLLCSLAQPIPKNMDGRALEDVFQNEFLAAHPPAVAGAQEPVKREGDNVYSPEEEAAIRNRLEALGYLGE